MVFIVVGKYVLCEKLFVMILGDVFEMVWVVIDKGVIFVINYYLCNVGLYLVICDFIVLGWIGKVLSVCVFYVVYLFEYLCGWWINDVFFGGGVIFDIVVYDVDMICFYLEEDLVEVVVKVGIFGMGDGVEDSVMFVWFMFFGVMV